MSQAGREHPSRNLEPKLGHQRRVRHADKLFGRWPSCLDLEGACSAHVGGCVPGLGTGQCGGRRVPGLPDEAGTGTVSWPRREDTPGALLSQPPRP